MHGVETEYPVLDNNPLISSYDSPSVKGPPGHEFNHSSH